MSMQGAPVRRKATSEAAVWPGKRQQGRDTSDSILAWVNANGARAAYRDLPDDADDTGTAQVWDSAGGNMSPVNVDDVIIKHSHGVFEVLSTEDFMAQYEVVQSEPPEGEEPGLGGGTLG